MENGRYTTVVVTADGRLYNLGGGEHAPIHPDCKVACHECMIVNAGSVSYIDLLSSKPEPHWLHSSERRVWHAGSAKR